MKDHAKEKQKERMVPVVDTMPADLLTPLSVYLKLSQADKCSFLLESVERGESLGRYSFIGVAPEMTVRGGSSWVAISTTGREEHRSISMFDYLREQFSGAIVEAQDELPPFVGGAIGYLGFNCCEWFEKSLRTDADERTDAEFMFFSSVIAFDHAKQIINLISLVRIVDETATNDRIAEAHERNKELRRTLDTHPISSPTPPTPNADTTVSSNCSKQGYEDAVREVKELIRAGECYQVVLSQCFSRRTTADPVSIYRAMRSLNPSPYMFLLRMPDRSIVGASPEMLVKSTGRELEYRPIAGTRPRGKTVAEDVELGEEMRADEKEVAEHLMLVDLGRNDLGRVAEYGSVEVNGLMTVEKYSHVQHLVSRLSARLRRELDRFDALAACFPAGTVSGAPKVRAIEIIRKLEPNPRDIYAGAVGYFDYGGNMDTCIAIRTMVLKDGVAQVQAGAGIVADSVPEAEYQETVNKAKGLIRAIELAETQAL